MNNLLREKKDVGVIVCRMQVPYLTESHKAIINTVIERHPRVVICLGVTLKPIDEKNPFPFLFRKSMIEKTFNNKNITIVPLADQPDNNKKWVNDLDTIIKSFLNKGEEAILYGGRDSFIPYYKKDKGEFNYVELAPTDYDSGTQLRELVSLNLPEYTPEAANAILFTMRQLNLK